MINEDMLQTAKEMVEIGSINSTGGEKAIGEYIERYIRNIDYFKKHPNQVIVRELKDDQLHRRNVLAILIGEKNNTGKTLLFHGHTDTVGLEGYGSLKDFACRPDELTERLKEVELSDEVRKDLDSGDYMFGRGACDMKSGDAVFLGILKEMSEHPEKMSGNIVVSFNPVEENLHTGILEATEILIELRQRYKLDYVMAINNDYICPLYPGDKVKTIYTGVVGKLLPCFYIQGKETHVGQCFEGLDASMMAAELLRNIHLNHEFSDSYNGEYSYPPSVLKIKDLKPWYNVQTAKDALIYFNYFVHNSSIEDITQKLKNAAEKTFETVINRLYEEADWFGKASHQTICKYEYIKRVYTYEELYNIAEKTKDFKGEKLTEIIKSEIDEKIDSREVPIAAIRYLLEMANITSPAIVLYYAAPYCPHNTLQEKDASLLHDIEQIAQEMTNETGEEYRMMKFFPSLSDSSYLRIDDDDKSIKRLIDNFPGMDILYNIPIDNIRALDIPAVNYGCYGKDAHKWTERVNIPYTFEVLPKLIKKTVDKYLVD
ncbi:M20/M25/M40 family metallo-hydrolase [Agathobacter sp.]